MQNLIIPFILGQKVLLKTWTRMVQYSFILINCIIIIIIANNNMNNMNNVKYKFTIENGVIKSISKKSFQI